MSANLATIASCPVCGQEACRVREEYTQATRYEPMKSLGRYGYCPRCAVSFRADHEEER